MNEHALAVLQFPRVLEVVSRHAASELGAQAVLGLRPSDARGWVEPELAAVDQLAAFLLRNDDWSVGAVPDLRVPLRRLGVEGAVWEGSWFRDAALLIASASRARSAIRRYGAEHTLLTEVVAAIEPMDDEAERIRQGIDEAGEVRDGASRELGRIRRDLRGARSRIVQQLEQFMGSLPERVRVADASVSVRDGRYVVPIRREGRSEVGGIVHDESSSGATLFVEPPVAIDLMNRLRELELAEAREVQRILRELTAFLRPRRDDLQRMLDALVRLDSLYARAHYAVVRNGHRPGILADGSAGYEIVDGRHPLLLEGAGGVVPFSLRLDEGERTLLVSGPNTGGKTVLLKAIGLLSAMAQAGIVPPVGPGTKLPVFRGFFADIGDEQSIEASLSTFSAHLRNLREVVEGADAASLVLIDEIGSGTDPAEGGALAQAVLVELTRRGALTVATSHLGQLKLLAGEEPGVVNASLQFDSRELKPTYRLIKGVPGRSYGIAIARRLGFPEDLLATAESFQPADERDANQLLVELEEKDRRLGEAVAEAEALRREAESLRRDLEEREGSLRRREREEERRARQQARDILLNARQEVESAIRDLREAVKGADAEAFEEMARETRRRVEEAASRQAEKAPEPRTRSRPSKEVRNLDVGDRVTVAATGADGVLVELRDGRATVESRGLRLQLPLRDLEPAEDEPAPAERRPSGAGWSAPDVEPVTEIDLRGLRADEVEGRLQPALDAAFRTEVPSLRIIHGKGTGALREVVAELLRGDRRVAAFRAGGIGEGGTGVTVVELG